MENKTDKGIHAGSCNRTACQKPNSAFWYNHSTRMYYCIDCAQMINRANHVEAVNMFGHDLCTYEIINHGK